MPAAPGRGATIALPPISPFGMPVGLARLPDDLAIHARGVTRVYKAKPGSGDRPRRRRPRCPAGRVLRPARANGAGKTTLIKILTTLLLPTSGTARVAGFDVVTETAKIRRVINMVARRRAVGLWPADRARAALDVQPVLRPFLPRWLAAGRRAHRDHRADRAEEQKIRTLSTGQRQKLNFARGLLNDPWVLFLDEPTLGLDVAAARDLREHTLAWKAAAPGRTLLLTTHYMVEAEQLCDRIAIVDRGRILALGTPEELRRRVQGESIFRLELDQTAGRWRALPRSVPCRACCRPSWPTKTAPMGPRRTAWR